MKGASVGLLHDEKTSKDLFDLLSNYMLVWDPRKRATPPQIYKHSWFDEIRNN